MARRNNLLARNAVEKAIGDTWLANTTLTTAGFTLNPANSNRALEAAAGKDYAVLHVMPAGADVRALGQNGDFIRGQGIGRIQCFIRQGTGNQAADRGADALDQLSNTSVNSADGASSLKVHFRQVSPAIYSHAPSNIDPGWEMWIIEVPYFWDSDDIKALA